MKKPGEKANPKEEKKGKDAKATTGKETVKKIEKKDDPKAGTSEKSKVITKKTGTETKINISKKEEAKKEEEVDDAKKHHLKQAKTLMDTEKKEFTSIKDDDNVSVAETMPSHMESSTNLIKTNPVTDVSNDSKGFNTVISNQTVPVDMKDSLAQKEKEINQLKQAINEKKQMQDELNKLIKEANLLKKEKAELSSNKEQLEKDNEMFSNELSTLLEDNEKLVKTNLDMTSKINELEEKAKKFDWIEQDIENLKIDLEIKNEECEGLKLELLNSKNTNYMDLDPGKNII
jgi:hypothetical protein